MKPPIGPLLPGTRQVLLTFNEGKIRERQLGDSRIECYNVMPHLSFLPKGLMIWGATGDTLVHSVKVGNMSELEVGGYAPIPGRYFEQGRSFEDLQRLADAGELELAVEQRQILDMSEAAPGVGISVQISGPYDRFCLWGLTYSGGNPHRRAQVTGAADGTFSARLDEVTLRGVATVLEVTAPDATTAAHLLAALESSRVDRMFRGR